MLSTCTVLILCVLTGTIYGNTLKNSSMIDSTDLSSVKGRMNLIYKHWTMLKNVNASWVKKIYHHKKIIRKWYKSLCIRLYFVIYEYIFKTLNACSLFVIIRQITKKKTRVCNIILIHFIVLIGNHHTFFWLKYKKKVKNIVFSQKPVWIRPTLYIHSIFKTVSAKSPDDLFPPNSQIDKIISTHFHVLYESK